MAAIKYTSIIEHNGEQYLIKDTEARELITNLAQTVADNKTTIENEVAGAYLKKQDAMVTYLSKDSFADRISQYTSTANLEAYLISKEFIQEDAIDGKIASEIEAIRIATTQSIQNSKELLHDEIIAFKEGVRTEITNSLEQITDENTTFKSTVRAEFDGKLNDYVLKTAFREVLDNQIVALTNENLLLRAELNTLKSKFDEIEEKLISFNIIESNPISVLDENNNQEEISYIDDENNETNFYYVEEE